MLCGVEVVVVVVVIVVAFCCFFHFYVFGELFYECNKTYLERSLFTERAKGGTTPEMGKKSQEN
jgi:hypothetical protein